MGSLAEDYPGARELVTEVLDETLWRSALHTIVQLLLSKSVDRVTVDFGFVPERDLRVEPQTGAQSVKLVDLQSFIETSLKEGTIERNGSSDFIFSPIGAELRFMLCNDSDLHFASIDPPLLMEVADALGSTGIRIYDSGNPI